MSQPVCIYFSKEGCPACVRFTPEWEKTIRNVGNRYRMHKFTCNSVNPPPTPFRKYVNYFPTIIMCSSEQYDYFFDKSGKLKNKSNYTIPAVKFNAVELPNGSYSHAGKLDNAENLISWLNNNAPRFMSR